MIVEPVAGRRSLVALLKFLARGPAKISGEGVRSALVRLEREDNRAHEVPEKLFAAACARGLVDLRKGEARLPAPGRAALKRWMSGGEDAFAAQHRHMEMRKDGEGGLIGVNLAESPLTALGRLKRHDGSHWFGSNLVAAGDRLRTDFTKGLMTPAVTSRWEPAASRGNTARSSGIADLTDAALAARLRVSRAVEAVGPELAGLLIDVCCYLKGLETVERERHWPQRSAKLLLRAGLQMLARHYEPPCRDGSAHIRNWGGENYRPEIGAGPMPEPAPDAPRP